MLISTSPSNAIAYAAARRLLALVQGSTLAGTADEPICRHLPALEEGLRLRAAEAQAAAGTQGATGATVVQALEMEAHSLGARSNGAAPHAGVEETVPQDAFEKACRGSAFRAVAAKVLTCDLATAQGRIDAIGSGFDGKSVLTVRALMSGSESLAKRHSLLESFRGLRAFIPEYFKWTLTVDLTTGMVPTHLLNGFSFAQYDGTMAPILEGLLKFQVLELNWVDPPYGHLGLKAAREQSSAATINKADHYSRPDLLADLGDYMHTAFVALGAAAISVSGFTAKTWITRYEAHIRKATGLAKYEERVQWLKRADAWFRASLSLIGVLWKAAIHNSAAHVAVWDFVLPFDCEMAKGMDDAEKYLKRLHEERHFFIGMSTDMKPADLHRLPLLSAVEQEEEEPGDAPLGRAGEGDYAPPEPGSNAHTWKYLMHDGFPSKLLLMSRTVWDTEAEARYYEVPWDSKCWPFLNSGRAAANLMGQCSEHTKAGHNSVTDSAHVLEGFDRDHAFENFTRAATAAEVAMLAEQAKGHYKPSGSSPAAKRRNGKKQHFRKPSGA